MFSVLMNIISFLTVSGSLSGKHVRFSCSRSWVRVLAGLYQRPSYKMVQTASLHCMHVLG